jgi:predicted dithiol-disulfide oxidoreductase (DUF899 family)
MFPGCPSCASITDGFDASTVHLENHDVGMVAICRTPIEELAAFRRRMGWRTPLVSSAGSDFNYDFGVSFTDEQLLRGATYNFRAMPPVPADELDQWPRDLPGVSAFALEDGVVFHTYYCSCRSLIMRAELRSGRSGRSWRGVGDFDATATSPQRGPAHRPGRPAV